MDEGNLISYFVVGLFGFILALVFVSVLRRRERARHVMIEHDQTTFGAQPVLAPPRRQSTLDIGRELAPEIERLILAGDKPAAVALIRQRAGLGQDEAERVVEMMEKMM